MPESPERAWIEEVWLVHSSEVKLAPDWQAWLHEVFSSQGAVGRPELEEQAAAAIRDRAQRACDLVVADVLATTGESVEASINCEQSPARVVFNGWTNGQGLYSIGAEELTVEVADTIQEEVMDDSRVWPECSEHKVGLHPELSDGRATWVCRWGNHSVAAIGAL